MKYFPIMFSLALTACTTSQGPVYVQRVSPIVDTGMGCGIIDDDTIIITDVPLLDIAAGEPDVSVTLHIGGFDEFFSIESNPPLAVTGGRQLAAGGRDRVLIQQIVLRYASKPSIPGITAQLTDTIPKVVPVSRPGEFRIFSPLFGSNARARLEALSPSNTDKFQFTTTIEVQGVTEPGGTPWRSQPIAMPITLVKSEVSCPGQASTKLKRYTSAGDAPTVAETLCKYRGLGRRMTQDDCCTVFRPEIPGCEQAP